MKVFSVLREVVGGDSVEVRIELPATKSLLLKALFKQYPTLEPYRKYVTAAVNLEYVVGDIAIVQGDELAIMMPASGG